MYGSSANAPTEYDQVSEMTQGMGDLATVHAKFDNLIAAVSLAGEAQQSGFEELRMGQHDLADTLATTTATLASMTGVSAVGVGGTSSYAKAISAGSTVAHETQVQLTPYGQ